MSRYIKDIETRDDFKKLLKVGTIIVVKAGADWCGPCKKVAPLVKDLLEMMPKSVKMLVVDVDSDADLATFFDIKQVPTFISYVGKDKMDVFIGSNEKGVRAFFDKVAAHAGMCDLCQDVYGSK